MEEIRWWWNDGNPQARSYINPGALDGKYGPSDLYDILVNGDYSMFKRKAIKHVTTTNIKKTNNNDSTRRRVRVKVKIKRKETGGGIACGIG